MQHFVAVVAAPVGASHFHQFEVLEFARAWYVGAAAEVFKGAFAVETDIFIGGNAGNDLGLVVLAHVFEIGDSIITR